MRAARNQMALPLTDVPVRPRGTVPAAEPLSAAADPQGSYVAAHDLVKSGAYKGQCDLVHAALKRQKRLVTSRKLAELMGADRHMVAKRLPDLERQKRAMRGGVDVQTRQTLWKAL